jgi:hypothetical protein
MRSDTVDIDKLSVGKKLMRLATEAVDDGVNAAAAFTKISLTTKKLRLDWEISTEALEDGIEGNNLEDHIAQVMATQAGNDLEDVAINGDTALTGDPLYKSFDGWRKRALAGAHVVAGGSTAISKAHFNSALKALPRQYKSRRNQLRFYTGSNLVQDYLYNLSVVGTNQVAADDITSGILRGNVAGPEGQGGGVYPFAFGIPIFEVPLFKEDLTVPASVGTGDHGYIELTFPQNRIVGIKRDITIYRTFAEKKDSIEFTMYTRMGVQIENLDAFVVVKDVKVA